MPRSLRVFGLLISVLAFLGVFLAAPRSARADAPGPQATPVAVLDIQTDDADDQADALTQAIRARVRATPGWSLSETTQSLGKLMIVLKCPSKPDGGCLNKIADTIKLDRFVWGQMSKKGDQVVADLHLFTRGKPETHVAESYSDNLKDPSDDALKRVAAHAIAQLTGSSSGATVVVHAGSAVGSVLVDGREAGKLDNGVGRVSVPQGSHSIEVHVAGMEPWSRQVSIVPGADQEVTAQLSPAKTESTPVTVKSNTPVRKIVAYSALGLGVIALGVGVYEGVNFLGLKNDLDNDRSNVSSSVTNVCEDKSTPSAIDACSKYNDAKSARTLEWVFVGAGAALVVGGVILLVTDHGSDESDAPKAGKVRVLPMLTGKTTGVDLSVTF